MEKASPSATTGAAKKKPTKPTRKTRYKVMYRRLKETRRWRRFSKCS
jgi:hypothetical protein